MLPAFWHAVAMLRLDRPLGLEELERLFAGGQAAQGLVGPRKGRVLAVTVGYGLDGVFEALSRAWMPWRGKTFSREAPEGTNLFTRGGGIATRVWFPGYRGLHEDPELGTTAFRFRTDIGPSAFTPGLEVLRIDYRNVRENPGWPVRRVLDELVQIGPELYLGQALLWWGNAPKRVAWFSLESPPV
jgi:hypothetical protein